MTGKNVILFIKHHRIAEMHWLKSHHNLRLSCVTTVISEIFLVIQQCFYLISSHASFHQFGQIDSTSLFFFFFLTCVSLCAMTSCLHHYGISLFSHYALISLSVGGLRKGPEKRSTFQVGFQKWQSFHFTGQSRKRGPTSFDLTRHGKL